MKPHWLFLTCLFIATVCEGQQKPADTPPTKEEIAKYFEVMHVRDRMKYVLESVTKETTELVHEQVKREAPDATPEFNAAVDGMLVLDDPTKKVLIEEMLTNLVPVYQKHLSKGDLAALLAFYSTPVGQRLIKEVPAVTEESMQATQAFMQSKTSAILQRVHELILKTQKEAKPKTDQPASTTPTPPAPAPSAASPK